jgi:hypothetical protein
MHLSVDVVGIDDGLGDFLAQQLRVPPAKAVAKRGRTMILIHGPTCKN